MAEPKKGKSQTSVRRRLGRGLSSLISAPVEIEVGHSQQENPAGTKPMPKVDVTPSSSRRSVDHATIQHLRLEVIHARSNQPRQFFDEEALNQLANSIRSAGLVQPILVRPDQAGEFEIIAGERRWRAARIAGLESIPAIIRELDDEGCSEWSLIENLQREDLNPIERAEAFRQLIEEYQLTHQEAAKRVGLNRSSITNHLRLNDLDELCKVAVRDGKLSMGHAKVLLGIANIPKRQTLAKRVIQQQWSVRHLEQVTGPVKHDESPPQTAGEEKTSLANPQIEDLQRRLGEHLGSKVRIIPGRKPGAGKLVVEFFDLDHFENLMQTLQFPLD